MNTVQHAISLAETFPNTRVSGIVLKLLNDLPEDDAELTELHACLVAAYDVAHDAMTRLERFLFAHCERAVWSEILERA